MYEHTNRYEPNRVVVSSTLDLIKSTTTTTIHTYIHTSHIHTSPVDGVIKSKVELTTTRLGSYRRYFFISTSHIASPPSPLIGIPVVHLRVCFWQSIQIHLSQWVNVAHV